MSHSPSRWIAAALAVAVSLPHAFAQDPIPVGYSPGYYPYAQAPAWGSAAPAYMPPPAYPHPQPTLQLTNRATSAPVAAAPVVAAAPSAGGCSTCNKFSLFQGCHPFGTHLAAIKAHLHAHLQPPPGWHQQHHPRPPIVIDSIPTNPYVRSPRDFFMFYDNLEAERSRDLRPTLIP